MDLDNVRVLETGRGGGFATEPLHRLPGGQRTQKQQFDRDHPVQLELSGLEHDPHAATPDFLDQGIVTQALEVGR